MHIIFLLFISLLIQTHVCADSAIYQPSHPLIIPSVSVSGSQYAVSLTQTSDTLFQLAEVYGVVLSEQPAAVYANDILTIHSVLFADDLYLASLSLIENSNPLTFQLNNVQTICNNCAKSQGISADISLYSSDMLHNSVIQDIHTCSGNNASPSFTWTAGPTGTQSYVLIMDDPDAQRVVGYTWVHMNLFNLPSSVHTLASGISTTSLPTGAVFGINDSGGNQYSGPCPPEGDGIHHYNMRVYALDKVVSFPDKAITQSAFETQYANHIISQSNILTGLYER